MLLIYTHKITKRVKFTFKLIFKQMLGLEFDLTSNADKFIAYAGSKFTYSNSSFGKEMFFQSSDLLFQTGIEGQELNVFSFEKNKAFFPVYNNRSSLPFDAFAATFFLVTRYEEYLPYMRDRFGRFDAPQSISSKYEFLRKPLVNIWVYKIKDLLKVRFSDLVFGSRKFQFVSTIDIDSAYAYKYKGTVRTFGGILSSLVKFELSKIAERFLVIAGLHKDPFDTYAFQLQLLKTYRFTSIYFILLGDYSKYDKNIPVNNRHFQTLIKSLGDYAEVGIHPSYDSNDSFDKLKTEIERLSKILNREITKSRQHFLKLTFPSTYRNLINLDITDDYTMGYAAEPGFRAGICDPYYFYDLDLETETNLLIHPFQYMEGTLKDYMYKTREQSLEIIKMLIDEVKAVDGTFVSLWHNESLSNANHWKGWHEIYIETIRYACSSEK
ncbi:MAG: polysaccharide deacetylase family protein [Bacteroidales bacterium]|nr:polysaccharide deacetylase family protein [Bacteroidales bacterium]